MCGKIRSTVIGKNRNGANGLEAVARDIRGIQIRKRLKQTQMKVAFKLRTVPLSKKVQKEDLFI